MTVSSKSGPKLQMIEPIHRFHFDTTQLVLLEHLQRHGDPSGAQRPYLAIEVGQVLDRLTVDADDQITTP